MYVCEIMSGHSAVVAGNAMQLRNVMPMHFHLCVQKLGKKKNVELPAFGGEGLRWPEIQPCQALHESHPGCRAAGPCSPSPKGSSLATGRSAF